MANLYEEIEYEEVFFCQDVHFEWEKIPLYEAELQQLVENGSAEGDFDSDTFKFYSGLKWSAASVGVNEICYKTHAMRVLEIPYEDISKMLKGYVVFCIGKYIYHSIAYTRTKAIIAFLEKLSDRSFRINVSEQYIIKEFLAFACIPEAKIVSILNGIKRSKTGKPKKRKLSPPINYFAIQNAVEELYSKDLDNDTFIKWFPVFFWAKVTFVLPLRATEMLVTPLNCIGNGHKGKTLTIRRTLLKKHRRKVYYDINKDYEINTYTVPNSNTIGIIEKYQELTKDQDRRFLFKYNERMINEMVSLRAFNVLLAKFQKEYIIGNRQYEYARYAAGIEEFEYVTAGDSRPIAINNLYYLDYPIDVIKKLAGHEKIQTSAGYYTNVSETIMASSIMLLQKRIHSEINDNLEKIKNINSITVVSETGGCTSQKHRLDPKNLEDCELNDCLEECFGCEFHSHTKEEIEAYIEKHKKAADKSARKAIEYINKAERMHNNKVEVNELILGAIKEVHLLKHATDLRAEEKRIEWEKVKNTQMKSC